MVSDPRLFVKEKVKKHLVDPVQVQNMPCGFEVLWSDHFAIIETQCVQRVGRLKSSYVFMKEVTCQDDLKRNDINVNHDCKYVL